MISFTDRMSFLEEFQLLKQLRKKRSAKQERFKNLQKEMRRIKDQRQQVRYRNSTTEEKEKKKMPDTDHQRELLQGEG